MSRKQSEEMSENIHPEELDLIIKNCPNNKSPGFDGLSYEFYKTTWPLIRETFTQVLQCQLDRERLIGSDMIGAVRLLPKVEGTPKVDELRPITLLNCDYKILSKLLVRRIRPVLPDIIQSGQLCSVGNRNILFGAQNIISSISYVNQKNRAACLLSLDFFKAYDRVMVSFLLLVMKQMGFSDTFVKWIGMLHEGAQAKFLLGKLSKAISINFSIRQGDPIAMILYIIYVEPLLIMIQNRVNGLKMSNFQQDIEAYCDDINLMTEDDSDLQTVDNAVRKFERVSGAILSRNQKCKVIGFGRWKGRQEWPLSYVKTVSEIKIFGVVVENSVSSLIRKNWDLRFAKFQATMISWSSRVLETIFHRVDSVKIFALTRLYYIAAVLPVTKTFCEKINKVVGKFVWSMSGKFLRVSHQDSRKATYEGGLGLTCFESMANSLRFSQLLRLLKNGDQKSVNHINYWIGEILGDFLPNNQDCDHASVVPSFFLNMADLVAENLISESVSSDNWRRITNKMIYRSYLKNSPPTKIEQETGSSMEIVWKRLSYSGLPASEREILYLLVHNKLPVKERIYRVGQAPDPYCNHCFTASGAVDCDVRHFFCSCLAIVGIWGEVKTLMRNLLPDEGFPYEDSVLISMKFPPCDYEGELLWLLSSYVHWVWLKVYEERATILDRGKFFGYLRFKFKQDQIGAKKILRPFF